jgi:hypothetical protein
MFPTNPMSPFTSNLARGRFVPTPTLELTVSTKRLAVPTETFPPTTKFEERVVFPETAKVVPTSKFAVIVWVLDSILLTLMVAFLISNKLSGGSIADI